MCKANCEVLARSAVLTRGIQMSYERWANNEKLNQTEKKKLRKTN